MAAKISNDLVVQAMRIACAVTLKRADAIAEEVARELEKLLQLPHNTGVDVKELVTVAFEADWNCSDEIQGETVADSIAKAIRGRYGVPWA